MSDGSSIEWCDATWTIAIGCTRVSQGCDHCYAATFVHRGLHETHRGLTKLRPKDSARPGVDWNGTVRTLPERLADPLKWKKPRRVFVGSMTDLFHPSIPFEYIAAVFGVMNACRQHTFMVLTKRDPRPFFEWIDRSRGGNVASVLMWSYALQAGVAVPSDTEDVWPLPNVHLGVSVEDQQHADERIPALLQCPAAVHWVSAEPLLGPVDLRPYLPERATLGYVGPEMRAKGYTEGPILLYRGHKLKWLVVGGESGPGARPFHVQWARDIIRAADGVAATFVKQIGSKPIGDVCTVAGVPMPERMPRALKLVDRKGGAMDEWPSDLRVRELPP